MKEWAQPCATVRVTCPTPRGICAQLDCKAIAWGARAFSEALSEDLAILAIDAGSVPLPWRTLGLNLNWPSLGQAKGDGRLKDCNERHGDVDIGQLRVF